MKYLIVYQNIIIIIHIQQHLKCTAVKRGSKRLSKYLNKNIINKMSLLNYVLNLVMFSLAILILDGCSPTPKLVTSIKIIIM